MDLECKNLSRNCLFLGTVLGTFYRNMYPCPCKQKYVWLGYRCFKFTLHFSDTLHIHSPNGAAPRFISLPTAEAEAIEGEQRQRSVPSATENWAVCHTHSNPYRLWYYTPSWRLRKRLSCYAAGFTIDIMQGKHTARKENECTQVWEIGLKWFNPDVFHHLGFQKYLRGNLCWLKQLID